MREFIGNQFHMKNRTTEVREDGAARHFLAYNKLTEDQRYMGGTIMLLTAADRTTNVVGWVLVEVRSASKKRESRERNGQRGRRMFLFTALFILQSIFLFVIHKN